MRRPLLLLALAAVVYLGAAYVPQLRAADAHALYGFIGLTTLPGAGRTLELISLFDPAPFAALTLLIVALGVLFGRVRAGLLGAGMMVAAEVSAQVLKPLLAVQRDVPFLEPAAWPSGHTTAVMGFALALAIVAPPRLRPYAVAAGALLTVLTVNALLMAGSHYPSDVLGGLLLASAWASGAVLLLGEEERVTVRGPLLASGALFALFALAVLPRVDAAVDYAIANTTFALGALTIAAAALVLSGSVPAPTGARRRLPPDSPRG
ncbi:phosphatase PAP2 family protein [Solirubrobacter sp. CPCC 204708]|uniref:Phosphatase PAP2 family protein n=1 Tax=Solirubrobacter deserti TaxID=2282478 RepID=A0ABT4RDM3_9ACTN|nr:phosphatase PAP2 family protein [Solirubrobacter deserti]MBE2314631.1 phosphatase PAP2 family protein [Solirubrobacter deserti]MDA0136638.1 phosphatase PAP2 family protein [Solirubrobacter deserti]